MSGAWGLDPVLLEVLACPCPEHAPLRVDEAAPRLVCTKCEHAFEIRDGIPIMLLDEA